MKIIQPTKLYTCFSVFLCSSNKLFSFYFNINSVINDYLLNKSFISTGYKKDSKVLKLYVCFGQEKNVSYSI